MSAEYSVESLQHLILSQHSSTSAEAIAALRAFQGRIEADESAGVPFCPECGTCRDNPPAQAAQEGPGEEDGPWAEGWAERSGATHPHSPDAADSGRVVFPDLSDEEWLILFHCRPDLAKRLEAALAAQGQGEVKCPQCNGDGYNWLAGALAHPDNQLTCDQCKGSGVAVNHCRGCRGIGGESGTACPDCNGTGQNGLAPPASPAGVPDALRDLSEQASPDWSVDDRRIGGGSVVGGATFHYTNGSGQTQLASFSCPRLDDDDPRDPTAVQNANARFAVECVKFVRNLLAAPSATPEGGEVGL